MHLGDISILYGRSYLGEFGHATRRSLGVVRFQNCPGREAPCNTVGLPVVAEIALSAHSVIVIRSQEPRLAVYAQHDEPAAGPCISPA